MYRFLLSSDKKTLQLVHLFEESIAKKKLIYWEADDLVCVAEHYMTVNKEEMANKAISLCLKIHPRNDSAILFLSKRELYYGNLTKAKKYYAEIANPADIEVQLLRIEFLLFEEKIEEAEHRMSQVCQAYRPVDDVLSDCIDMLMDYELWEQAERWCKKLEKINPRYENLHELQAEIYINTDKVPQAQAILQEKLEQNPFQIGAWTLLADAYLSENEIEKSMEACNYALAIDPKNERANMLLGECFCQVENYEKAHQCIEKVLETIPNSEAYKLNSICLAQMKCYEEAAENLKKSLTPFSNKMKYYIDLAQLKMEEGMADEAHQAMQKARQYKETDDDATTYYEIYGKIWLHQGNEEQAAHNFQQALEQSGYNEHTLQRIGIHYYREKHYLLAKDYLEQACLSNDSFITRTSYPLLAYCYYQLSMFDPYLTTLRKACSEVPGLTTEVFNKMFPGIKPEEYYAYAYKSIHGVFPEEG